MNAMTVVDQLGALAQETRLEIFKLLAKAGPDGMPAGEISKRLNVLPATLSFHLAQLGDSGLLRSRRQGRFIIFSTNCATLEDLMAFMGENFCGGAGNRTNPACRPVGIVGRTGAQGVKPGSPAQDMLLNERPSTSSA